MTELATYNKAKCAYASITVSNASRDTFDLAKEENKSLINAFGKLGTTTPASDTLHSDFRMMMNKREE